MRKTNPNFSELKDEIPDSKTHYDSKKGILKAPR